MTLKSDVFPYPILKVNNWEVSSLVKKNVAIALQRGHVVPKFSHTNSFAESLPVTKENSFVYIYYVGWAKIHHCKTISPLIVTEKGIIPRAEPVTNFC